MKEHGQVKQVSAFSLIVACALCFTLITTITKQVPRFTRYNAIFFHGKYHGRNHMRAVAQHCINGDSLSQWRRAKFDPHRMETPEPIAKKFGTVNYVRETTPCAKFRANPSTGGFSANA